jgi:serine/threonine protein kinase
MDGGSNAHDNRLLPSADRATFAIVRGPEHPGAKDRSGPRISLPADREEPMPSPEPPNPPSQLPPDLTPGDLATLLVEFTLLEPGQAEELPSLCDQAPDARALARELLLRDWLTAYQVNQVFQGKADALLLGPYLLLERGEADDLGQVYKARHRTTGRLVSLHLFPGELLADAAEVDHFRREVQALAQVSHPNLLLAHDAGQAGGTVYLATDYVEGVHLGQLVHRQGPLPVARACALIREVARGLQHAFECGFVHHDLKPSALLLDPGGTVKVRHLNFGGLPRGILPEGSAERDPAAADYLAPEQGEGRAGADVRADVYSLGGILHFLLTGMPPFPGGSFHEKRLQQRSSGPPPLHALCPEAPAELEAVVRRMMARRPEDRYSTPGEVARHLDPFARGTPAHAPNRGQAVAPIPAAYAGQPATWPAEDPYEPPPRPPISLAPLPEEKSFGLWFLAGILMILVAAGTVAVAFWPRAGSTPPRAQLSPPGDPPEPPAPQPGPKPPAPEPKRPDSILDRLRAADVPPEARPKGALGDHLVGILGRPADPPIPVAPVRSLAFGPNGSFLLAAGGQLRSWDCITQKEQERFPPAMSAAAVAVSPERKVALTIADTVTVWDLGTGKSLGILGEPAHKVTCAGFLDKERAFTAGGDGVFRVWNLATRAERHGCPLGFTPRAVGILPGGTEAVFLTEAGQLRRWDWQAQKEVHVWGEAVTALAVAPDGGRIYFGGEDSSVGFYEGMPKEPLTEEFVHYHSGAIVALALSSDGKRLATADKSGGVVLWDTTANRFYSWVAGWERPEVGVQALAFAPDDRHLAVANADGTIHLVRWPEKEKGVK